MRSRSTVVISKPNITCCCVNPDFRAADRLTTQTEHKARDRQADY